MLSSLNRGRPEVYAPRPRLGAAGAIALILALGSLAAPPPAGAGGTPDPGTATSGGSTLPDQLLHQAGEDRGRANGDWVSDNDGGGALNTFYQYFIEVPPGQGQLVVQIYDADIGVSGANDNHDGRVGGSWTTGTEFELYDPSGTSVDNDTVGASTCVGIAGGCDNSWVTMTTVNNPTSGHWRLTVDTTTFGGTTDDHQNYGIRAHDGNAGAGGTEYNVYAQSYLGMGESSAFYTTNRNYDFFPYVYRGCTVDFNDFDSDDGGLGISGSYDVTTRSGNAVLTNYNSLSGNDAWNNNAVTGWTSDFAASDYGIWRYTFTGAPAQGLDNNVYTIYVGADNSPNPAPTTQPVASAVRLYFPRDGSTYANGSGTILAPVRPYVGHTWAKVAGEPAIAVGTTTRIEVTVTVTNPGAFPIQFSAAAGSGNRVIATVPTNSGQTAYVTGSISASQGLVSATGTGPWTMNWGPGVVAAGATATLTYRIDITPTSAGTKLLTGTPAASGTTATFIDGTCANQGCGGARLTGATFTFGPLCELRATVQDLTPALVAGFRGRVEDGGLVVEWETAAEAGTLAFDLYRREGDDWRKVNEGALAAVLSAPQGGRYRLLDAGASPRERQSYLLVEHESDGGRKTHGPFAVEPIWERAESAAPGEIDTAEPYHAEPRRQAAPPAPRTDRAASAGAVAAPQPRAVPPPTTSIKIDRSVRLGVTEPGVYRVDAAELAPLLGFPEITVANMIRLGMLRLSHRGLPVASWDGGGAIEFYAEGIDSPFTRENVYFLTFAQGVLPAIDPGVPPAPAPADLAFADRLDAEQDLRPVVLLPLDPEGDTWFWDILQAGHPSNGSRTFALAAPGVAPGAGPAGLTVRLQGGSVAEHAVDVEVNGAFVGTVALSGIDAAEAVFELPPGLLADGANQVTVTAAAGGFVLIDGFGLAYDRLYQADASHLALRGDGHPAVTVRGLGAGARVLEITEPRHPVRVPAAVAPDGAGGWQATFAPAEPDDEYLAYDPAFVRRPATVAADAPSSLLVRQTGAEYLVIAPAELLLAARELADYRAAGGLSAMAVDLQDVYDEVNFGIADPRAIRDFLLRTRTRWGTPPRYVVLAGAGTYDYRDNLGFGGNLIPPMLALSDLGAPSLYATDALYGDLDGGDGVPEVMVGRIPVTTAAALSAYVDKLIAYESAAQHPGAERVILAADQADSSSDFPADGDAMAAALASGYAPETVYLSDFGTTAAARAALFAGLGEGAGALVYLGHGGADRLAGEGLLTNADVAGLGNGDRLPVIAAVTCHIGLHALPGFDALGELLVRQPDGGAIAVFAPGWLSNHGRARELGEALLRRLTEGDGRLGDAVREAAGVAAGLGAGATVLHTYQLFGDPALKTRIAPAPPTGGGDPPEPGGA